MIYPRVRYIFIATLLLCILFGMGGPVLAQTNSGIKREQLLQIAGIMGAVHYLHGQCDGKGTQIWRDNMKRLIEIEKPAPEVKQTMIERFNAQYEIQRKRFHKCNKKRAKEAARLAEEGERLTAEMVRQLSE